MNLSEAVVETRKLLSANAEHAGARKGILAPREREALTTLLHHALQKLFTPRRKA